MGLYKSACACKINGRLCDLRTTVAEDCDFEILTFENKDGRQTFWHTASHLLAQAVKNLYPNAKLGRGLQPKTDFITISAWKSLFPPMTLKKTKRK
jgi:threonyl-tRNA synthetase